MPGVRDIKRRIRSVNNTKQITKAMEMVAAAKLRRAQEKAVMSRPFANKITEVLERLITSETVAEHPFLQVRPVKSIGYVVIAGDRGLCGAFNTNVIRKAVQSLPKGDTDVSYGLVTVGRKVRDFFRKRRYPVQGEFVNIGDSPSFVQAREIARFVVNLYQDGIFDEVYLVYGEFVTALQQRPVVQKVLPVEKPEVKRTETGLLSANDYIYEPSPAELLSILLPKYVETQVYRALLESKASEHGARMTAMGAATDNASEMIDRLTLSMNKARQAAITKELIDIVSGANAVKR